MSLLSDLLKESAAGGSSSAGGIANNRGSLFGGSGEAGGVGIMRRMGYVNVDDLPSKRKKKPRKKFSAIKEAVAASAEVKPYDYQDTLAKLDQAVKTAAEGEKDNVAVFGLEDEEGKIVKVYVNKEEADNFEEALSVMLTDENAMFDGEDEPKTGQELAEIIYKLSDTFDIVDVEWGVVHGDEEEETDVDGIDPEGEGTDGEDMEGMEGEDLEGEDLEGDMEGMESDGTEEAAQSALQQVIATLQGEAEAKKAEADARRAEAEATIAKHASDAAQAKVSQEEQILDMEEHEKAKKDAKKEAETLAKLAKYKQEVKSDGTEDDDFLPADAVDSTAGDEDFEDLENMETFEDEEEVDTKDDAVSKEDLARLILQFAQAQK